jgi:hypothetical protein
MTIKIEVLGDENVARNLKAIAGELEGTTMRNAMHDSTMMLTGEAQLNLVGYQSPQVGGVNTGELRTSISPAERKVANGWEGTVGTVVLYAPFVEHDTRPHFPPLAALEDWARAHGTSAWLVAKGIARSGTRGKHFLEKSAEENKSEVYNIFEHAVLILVAKYG